MREERIKTDGCWDWRWRKTASLILRFRRNVSAWFITLLSNCNYSRYETEIKRIHARTCVYLRWFCLSIRKRGTSGITIILMRCMQPFVFFAYFNCKFVIFDIRIAFLHNNDGGWNLYRMFRSIIFEGKKYERSVSICGKNFDTTRSHALITKHQPG